MLVISKRLVGKVQVDEITEQRGAKPSSRTGSPTSGGSRSSTCRDKLFLGLVLIGGAAFIYGLLEQSFTRRGDDQHDGCRSCSSSASIAAAAGFIGLLRTDGVSDNALFGVIVSVGVVVTVVGLALARWRQRVKSDHSEPLPPDARRRLLLGLGCIVLACLVPIPFDRHQSLAILTWTSPNLRRGHRRRCRTRRYRTGIALNVAEHDRQAPARGVDQAGPVLPLLRIPRDDR